jgi:hypothetical protein
VTRDVKDPVHAANLVVTNFSGGKRHTGRETIDQGALREMTCLASDMQTSDGFLEGLFRSLESDSSDDDSRLESSIVINGESESVHNRLAYGHRRVSNPDSISSRRMQLDLIARYVKQVQKDNNGLPGGTLMVLL